jgi:transcription antitermination factor NusG
MRAWYVIECREGKDAHVRLKLAAAGFDVWRPVREIAVTRRWKGVRKAKRQMEKRYVSRFGRYLFLRVEMSDSVRAAILEVNGVHQWLCMAGANSPASVPPELIEFYEANVAQPIDCGHAYKNGDRVSILAEPFAGFVGMIVSIDRRGIIAVEISVFGRPTPLILEVGHVEPVELRFQRPIGARRKSA